MQPDAPSLLIITLLGFLAGVFANLLADYLPARRHYTLAHASPFASVRPRKPLFVPRRADGRPAPAFLWSGLVAALMGADAFRPARRTRRILTEIGLAAAFAIIGSLYAGAPFLPFYLVYAVIFVIVIVIDVEHRWIMAEVTWSAAAIALAEVVLVRRLSLGEALLGGLYGFGIAFGLYLFGFAFAWLLQLLAGRRVSRTVFGFGDVQMAAFGGLILGAGAIGPALLLMMLSGGITALLFVIDQAVRKRRYRRHAAIPYGPHIVIGTALMLYLPQLALDILWWIIGLLRPG